MRHIPLKCLTNIRTRPPAWGCSRYELLPLLACGNPGPGEILWAILGSNQ